MSPKQACGRVAPPLDLSDALAFLKSTKEQPNLPCIWEMGQERREGRGLRGELITFHSTTEQVLKNIAEIIGPVSDNRCRPTAQGSGDNNQVEVRASTEPKAT